MDVKEGVLGIGFVICNFDDDRKKDKLSFYKLHNMPYYGDKGKNAIQYTKRM
jgi:hypothetical protein